MNGEQLTMIHDMAYAVKGDTARIEQSAGSGEVAIVDLHKIHIQLLASEMGLMRGDLNAWQRVATLERRMRVLQDRIVELDQWLHDDLEKDSGVIDMALFCTFSLATSALADEFCADFGIPANAEAKKVVNADEKTDAKTQQKPSGNLAETHGLSGKQVGLPLEVQQ